MTDCFNAFLKHLLELSLSFIVELLEEADDSEPQLDAMLVRRVPHELFNSLKGLLLGDLLKVSLDELRMHANLSRICLNPYFEVFVFVQVCNQCFVSFHLLI